VTVVRADEDLSVGVAERALDGPAKPAGSAPRHRSHDPERLGPGHDLFRERVVRRLERDVLTAGEEADEVTALRRAVVADRPAQRR